MKKNGKAYRKLYLSYTFIFLIPITMGILFYFYAYHVAKDQTDASNRSLIRTVKNTCDRELGYYENALIQLALNKNVQQLSAVRGEFRSDNSYQLYQLQNEISDLQVSINKNGSFCKDIMVYFKNSDKVVSSYGNMNFSMYCELYCFDEGETEAADKLERHLSEYHFRDSIRMDSKWTGGRPALLLTMTNLKGDVGESSAMIGIWLDMEALNSRIEVAAWESGLDWMIINREGQIMNRPEEYSDIGIRYDDLEQEGNQKTEWNGENYIVRTVFSDVFDWKYVLLMPERLITGPASKMKNIFVVGIFICLLTGFWAASRMTKINYNPLKALLEVFRKHDGEGAFVDNEYLYLKEKAMMLLEERSDFQQMVNRSREVVKQYYLTDLLINAYDESEDTPDRDLICKKFREGRNLVLLFMVKDAENRGDSQEEYIQKNSLRKFIIGNVFGEGLAENFPLEKVELGDMVAMLLNLGEENAAYEERLAEIMDAMQKFIYDNFNFRVAVLAGEAHRGLEGVHPSYMEAKKTEEFVSMLDPDYISYREIRNSSHKKYDYPTEQEERIIAAVKNHNSQLAVSYINKILDVNFLQIKASPEMFKYLLYDLIGTIMKAAQEVGETSDEELGLNEISIKLSLDKIKGKFASAVEKLCRTPEIQGSGFSQNQQLCQKIQEYIQANFSNPDLNISQTGLYFHMTPAYLSSIYKKCTGDSLLRLINQTRIDEAERLLAEGVSVVEAAERVGFRDSSTFIRTFKKFTGATPGQLKSGR